MLLDEREHERPEDGRTAVAKITVPVNPSSADVMIVEVADEPATTVTLVGLAAKAKSLRVNDTIAE